MTLEKRIRKREGEFCTREKLDEGGGDWKRRKDLQRALIGEGKKFSTVFSTKGSERRKGGEPFEKEKGGREGTGGRPRKVRRKKSHRHSMDVQRRGIIAGGPTQMKKGQRRGKNFRGKR